MVLSPLMTLCQATRCSLILQQPRSPREAAQLQNIFLFLVSHNQSIDNFLKVVHCNLIITLILGAIRNERYNEMSIIMKFTFLMK